MIIGLVSVYTCDGSGCGSTRVVVPDREGDLDQFMAEWFVGVHFDYCPSCKNKIGNLSIIDKEERTWDDISERLMRGIALKIEKAKSEGESVRGSENVH